MRSNRYSSQHVPKMINKKDLLTSNGPNKSNLKKDSHARLARLPREPRRSSEMHSLVGDAVDMAVGLEPTGVGPDEALGKGHVEAALDIHRDQVLLVQRPGR